MRFDDHRIAGHQSGEQSWICVPGRKRAAADHQGDTATDDFEALFHHQRRVLALRLFPARCTRHRAHFAVRISDGFQPAVLRMRAAGLERHHPALPGGHHHRMGDFEARLVQSRERFEADAGSAFDAELLPRRHRGERSIDQRLRFAYRILDFERNAVRRMLAGQPADASRLIEFELASCMTQRCGFAFIVRGFAVDLRLGCSG